MWSESVVINRISLFGVPWLIAVFALPDALDLCAATAALSLSGDVSFRLVRDHPPDAAVERDGHGSCICPAMLGRAWAATLFLHATAIVNYSVQSVLDVMAPVEMTFHVVGIANALYLASVITKRPELFHDRWSAFVFSLLARFLGLGLLAITRRL